MTVTTTVTPLASYRNERPYPFCPGCGHHTILDRLNEALVLRGIDPEKVVLVSDIGCSGLSDQYFATSAFHGLHGRSITYASGIKMARPDLTVVVIMGDGGTGIGGTHLLNAARRNIGITVVVMNNFNFGMTGGQHSTTTPQGAITSTTRGGNLERPLDICATVAVNGAGFVVRATSFDEDLSQRLAEAIAHPGFALLDIWELCTAYYVPNNKLSRRSLDEILDGHGFERGVIAKRDLPEYSKGYREATAGEMGKPILAARPIEKTFDSPLDRRFRLVIAGSAGGKIRSAARLVAEGAVASGLYAAQRDDYPITVMTGHSIAELIFDPEPIGYPAVSCPDALVLLTEDGLKKAGRYLGVMGPEQVVYVNAALGAVATRARIQPFDLSASGVRAGKADLALVVLSAVVRDLGFLPAEALESRCSGRYAEANRKSIRTGEELARSWRG